MGKKSRFVNRPQTIDGKNARRKKRSTRTTVSLQSKQESFFRCLGPGLITGAADNNPSGISTYSVTGGIFGYAPCGPRSSVFRS